MVASILDSIRHPLVILDTALRVERANACFYRQFALHPDEAVGRPFVELRAGSWQVPDLEAFLTASLASETTSLEIEGSFASPSGELRSLVLSIRRTEREASEGPALILAIEDVTGQREAERHREPEAGEAERRRMTEALSQASQASQLLRAVADNTADAIFVKDRSGKYLLFNEAAARFVGRPVEEVLGRDDTALFDPDGARLVRERDLQVMKSGQVLSKEEELTAAGTTRVYHALKAPYRDEQGNVIGLIGISRDVTERKRAEEALRRSEERYRLMLEEQIDVVCRVRADHVFLYANPAFCRLLGKTAEEIVGLRGRDITHPDDVSHVEVELSRMSPAHPIVTVENRVIDAAGQARWMEFVNRGFFGADGELLEFQVVGRDITARKRMEEALRESEERFRAFMDNCPAASFIKDEGGRFLYVNAAWLRQFDPEPADWLGKTDYDFWPREVADLFRASDRECLAQNRPLQSEEQGRLPAGGELRNWMVMKFPIGGEGRRVGGMAWDVTDRARTEEALRLRDRAIRAVTQGIIITDPNLPDNPILYASPGFEQVTGYPPDEVVGRNCRFLAGPDTDPETVARMREAIEAGMPCTVEALNYKKDGTPFWNELSISPIRDEDGRLTHFVGVLTDVSGRRQLQAQLLQSQKMEGIGRLAGGIAHDFNNMLAVINGYSEMLLARLSPQHPLRDYVEEIGKAGDRAAGLTRQLLAFSRRQLVELKILDLSQVLVDLDKMLRRLIGEDIELVTVGYTEPLYVKADAAQLEQVVVNLVVNARDAMPTGGSLTLVTRSVDVQSVPADLEVQPEPGPYVVLSVEDTGVGIEPEHLPYLFEPFFTTKEVGKGTGLGLSTVYGIVQQAGGFLRVESTPGQGSRFSVYLPRIESTVADDTDLAALVLPRGTETILVVEDEPMVRALMTDVLRRSGYTVLEALQADEALQLVDQYEGEIDLLLTDVVMPRMSGPALAEAVLARRPGTPVLFVSGYTDDAVLRHGVLSHEVELLQKPFSVRDLAERVRRILDQERAAEGRGVVLLVEDVADQRESLAEVLRGEGYGVLLAAEGGEALAILQQEPLPGIILFDLMMPGMNGWVFRHELRKDPRLRDIPTVVLSGQSDPAAAAGFLSTTASLQKPVDVEALLRIVREQLARKDEAEPLNSQQT